MNRPARKDEDSAWKHILQARLEQFLAFFFPALQRKIDWATRPAFLKQELQRILPDSEGKKHLVDALARVRLRNGGDARLLIHVEIQGRKTPDFAQRTYVCRYRIFDLHRERVVSLAVFTGKGEAPEGRYEESGLGDRLTLRFAVASTESFRPRWQKLESSKNPFAAVTLAHLALGVSKTPRQHLKWKEYVAGRLYEQGFADDDIIELYRFLDWLVVLPRPLQREYERHVDHLERRKTMPFLSLREQRAIKRGIRKGRSQGLEKGLEQGIEKGLREAAKRGLELRFGEEGRRLVSRVERLEGADALRRLVEAVFAAEGLDEIHPLLSAD